MLQDKHKEIAFFDAHAAADDYNVFSEAANLKLIDSFMRLARPQAGGKVLDLGCGSGIFTHFLAQRGLNATGLDLSPKLLELARRNFPEATFIEGDVEALPFEDGSVDAILLSGLVHHLPDPSRCAQEAFRVLKKSGRFMAFDPNRANPFMYLYRDRSSPLYSPVGVTENERPVLAGQVRRTFEAAGFRCGTDYLSGLAYRYVASASARSILPIYNLLDNVLFRPPFMKPLSPFVLTFGEKP